MWQNVFYEGEQQPPEFEVVLEVVIERKNFVKTTRGVTVDADNEDGYEMQMVEGWTCDEKCTRSDAYIIGQIQELQEADLSAVLKAQEDLKTTQDEIKQAQEELKATQEELKATQQAVTQSQKELQTAQKAVVEAQKSLSSAVTEYGKAVEPKPGLAMS